MTQEKPSGANPPDDGVKDTVSNDTAEDIPTLNETVDPSMAEGTDADAIHTLSLHEIIIDEEQSQNIATLEAIVFDGEDPGAVAPVKPQPAPAPAAASDTSDRLDSVRQQPQQPQIELTPAPPSAQKPLPQKSENPFLPQHILDRLNQGKQRNLVEEIAQSGAALDASTAILRTRARTERMHRPSFSEPSGNDTNSHFSRDKSAVKKQQLIDDLVDEYLPLLASELRRRLKKLLDE